MKKNFLGKIAVSAALVVGAIAPVAAQNKVVNVYNWAEYLAEDTLPGFERTTGIKVRYDTFDTNDIVQAKLLAGNSGYDVVTPSTHYAARYIEGKLLQPFDKSKIPNFKHLDPDIMAVVAQVDPGNNYLIPWGFGTNGLGYNVTKVKEIFGADADIANWDMLFKPENASKLKECGISLLDEPAQVLPAVLHYIGKDPNSSDEKDIRAAFDVLKKYDLLFANLALLDISMS